MDKLNKLGIGNAPPLSIFTKPVLVDDINKVIDKLNETFARTDYEVTISYLDVLGSGNVPPLPKLTKPLLVSEFNKVIDVINEAIDILNGDSGDLSSLLGRLQRFGINNAPELSKDTKPVLAEEFNLVIDKINDLITEQNVVLEETSIPLGAVTTKNGALIVLTTDNKFILTIDGWVEI